MSEPVLEVEGLSVAIRERDGEFSPVDRVSLAVAPGECLGLVGESGSGKSLTLKAILGLLPPVARVSGGEVRFGVDAPPRVVAPEEIRGSGVAMVFQEPMSALNPLMRAGALIAEACRSEAEANGTRADARALELMREVGIPGAEERMRAYPHELSGGLRQRVMIAMALAREPRVLLCDEPTTAVDVTLQSQILRLLDRVRADRGLAVVYVTHDLAVVGQICERVAVMYAGRVVETGPVTEVFRAPAHPYTLELLRSVPRLDGDRASLDSIGGAVPDPRSFPSGCRFHPRCFMAQSDCPGAKHGLLDAGPDRLTACIHHAGLPAERKARVPRTEAGRDAQ